jgi:hypothetical protein
MPIINLKGDAVIYTPPKPELTPELPASMLSVYYDSETDVELLLARDGQTLTIRVGTDRLELSGKEWRGLYSGVLNIGPGRPTVS